MIRHPAHRMDYDTLLSGLAAAVSVGHVTVRTKGELSLFCYTKGCVYDAAWTPITEVARGLVIDRVRRRIAGTPLPKFWNLGEGDRQAPALDFVATEKLDGSMIQSFWHDGKWHTTTKGSFDSDQAKVALGMLRCDSLFPGVTYLSELVGPSNKIVVPYPKDELRYITSYDACGFEHDHGVRNHLAAYIGQPAAKPIACASIADLIAVTAKLPATEEGFVLRFSDGSRLKLKGDEYKRLHAIISRLSPLTVWAAVAAGDDDVMRRELPEEFWQDFDNIRFLIRRELAALVYAIGDEARHWAAIEDRELGPRLSEIPDRVRPFIFPWRKAQLDHPKTRQSLYRAVRPDANKLEGYRASYAMNRLNEEAS